MVDIFSYLDYRAFLKDIYDDKKKQGWQLSYRTLGKLVGFNSAGFFTNIIKGKRGISSQIAGKFAEVFRLKIKEREYFEYLVQADQAKNQTQKKYYLDKAIALKKMKFKIKDVGTHQFYEKWYFSTIRELLGFMPFKGDCRTLAKTLYPSIKPRDAEKSIELLEKLKLIKKNKEGYYEQTDPFITSGDKITSANLAKFHMETAELAIRATDKCPIDQRNISTLTLGLSKEGYTEMVNKIRDFRQELMEIAKRDKKKARVYHVNFHVFPLTKRKRFKAT
ncbi:MAG: TIGR02147 family protein [Fibrobacteria bacterium]|nr:TIGR02147 family protein [Fibrobacteria bacterium]